MRFEQHRNPTTTQRIQNCRTRKSLRAGLAALVAAVGVSFHTAELMAENAVNVVLGSGSFLIPFNLAAGGSPPREVHLYMASMGTGSSQTRMTGDETTDERDRAGIDPASRKWELLDRQSPSVGSFQIMQTLDGTYWFATRTIDASGRPHPPGPIEPELKVTVDTTRPLVDLLADADADGKVTAVFSVEDATAAAQITVHYVTDTLQQWQTAKIDRDGQGGRFSLAPTDEWHLLSIRLRVLDAAGNETIVEKRVQRPRVAVARSTRLASGPLGFGNPLAFDNPAGFGSGSPFPAAGTPAIPGNSTELPDPSTADQISQDFGRAAANFSGPEFSGPSFSGPGLTGPDFSASEIEMLPSSITADSGTRESGVSGSGMSQRELVPTPPATPQTPAEAMRPLVGSQPGNPSRAQPGNPPTMPIDPVRSDNSVRSDDPVPETPFAVEAIPAPSGQPPSPTQLNRPALPEISDEISTSDPVASPWSPLDASRTRNPSREFSTEPTPRPVSPGELPSELPMTTQGDSNRPGDSSQLRDTQSRSAVAPREQRRSAIGSADPLDLERLAQRAVIRHSNSNQFSLDYEIEAIGGRGVEAIELYGTTDGGQTWKQWGSDPDKVSPFDIETNGEGIFGFQIVVVAANGLASPRPLAGDAPDIVVVVDETQPDVGISGAKYGESDRAGSLVIAYHCEDRYLMSRPITLAFSDSPSGPWTTIAAGLQNTGDYVWPADPQLPRQIFLRVDAIDQAGNVGGYVLEDPIDTRGLAPRARIRAFRAIPSR